MALLYITATLIILVTHASQIPDAVVLVVDSAFNGAAASGGFAGATIMLALRMGIARGIFLMKLG